MIEPVKSELVLPRKDFVATTVHNWKNRLFDLRDAVGEGFVFPDDEALEGSPLAGVGYATLFTYMHRRFGLPHIGGDDYKDLTAGWMISTPEPDVFLKVSPAMGTWFSFNPYVAVDSQEREIKLSEPEAARAIYAYRAALLDLLRPVCVRDNYINALGQLEDDETAIALLTHAEDGQTDDESGGFEVRFAPSSGYPMPLGFFGGEDWPTLVEIISSFGNGDLQEARKNAIRAFQDLAMPALHDAEWAVQRLVLIGAWADRQDLVSRAGLPEDSIARIDAELAPLNRTSPGEDLSVVAEMTDERLDAAKAILRRLGKLHSSHLGTSINHYRDRYFAAAVVAELGEGDLTGLVPDRPWMDSADYLELIRSRGDERLIAWAEAAQGNIHRKRAFINIGWNLFVQAEQEAKAAVASQAP